MAFEVEDGTDVADPVALIVSLGVGDMDHEEVVLALFVLGNVCVWLGELRVCDSDGLWVTVSDGVLVPFTEEDRGWPEKPELELPLGVSDCVSEGDSVREEDRVAL